MVPFYSINVRRMEVRLNENRVVSREGCGQLFYMVDNISEGDQGRYQCVTLLGNGTIRRTSAGNPHIVGKCDNFDYLALYFPLCLPRS